MTEDIQIRVRIPRTLHQDLKALAKKEVRTLNGEIVYLLLEAVKQNKDK